MRAVGDHDSFGGMDALYLGYKMTTGSFMWGLAYDVNVSKLRRASGTVGTFEINLIFYANLYKPNHVLHKKHSKDKTKCPEPVK